MSDSKIQATVKAASRGVRNFDVIAVDWQIYSSDAFVTLAAFSTRFSGCGKTFTSTGNVSYGSFGGYSDAAYDELIAKAYASTDKNERLDTLRAAEAHLIDSACIVPIVYNQTFYLSSKDISKVSFNGFGNFIASEMKQKNYRDYINND